MNSVECLGSKIRFLFPTLNDIAGHVVESTQVRFPKDEKSYVGCSHERLS